MSTVRNIGTGVVPLETGPVLGPGEECEVAEVTENDQHYVDLGRLAVDPQPVIEAPEAPDSADDEPPAGDDTDAPKAPAKATHRRRTQHPAQDEAEGASE